MNNAQRQLKAMGWKPRAILDIGAYKGDWTRETRIQFPDAKYTLIEPNDNTTLQTLKDRIINQVVSDSVKNVQWFSNGSTGDSMFQERTRHYANVTPVVRQTTTLDRLFSDETFDFIKVDCQGAELDILRGGVELLKRTDVVLLECPFAGQYNQGAPTFAEYIQYLDSIGFAPFDISELHHANSILIQIDIVFLCKTSPMWTRIQSHLTA